jgi:hypothetical protein
VALYHGDPGKVIAVGDIGVSEFDITTQSWTKIPSPSNAVWGTGRGMGTVQLSDGSIVIAGGRVSNGVPAVFIKKVFRFNP